ncbi:hypothetical protein FB451DRAFT_1479089 [Mycena latifolia]|nr:hypothetical protein FB451DRAFT_1479089 [Mycena latifolia]
MPPKGSGHIREADFRYNEDRTKVQCRVCAFGVPVERQTWIEVKSAARHLTSGPHLLAVGLAEDRANRLENLQKEREANSATTELRDIQIALPQFDGPVASAVNMMSEAEAKMWADYAENGADFSTGFDFEDTDARHRKLRQEGESFGLWNPNAMARKLGFGPEDEEVGPLMAAEDDEDDFLADVMRNIGELCLAVVVHWQILVSQKRRKFKVAAKPMPRASGFHTIHPTMSLLTFTSTTTAEEVASAFSRLVFFTLTTMSFLKTRPSHLAPAQRRAALPESVDPMVAATPCRGSRAPNSKKCGNREFCEDGAAHAESHARLPSCLEDAAVKHANVAVGTCLQVTAPKRANAAVGLLCNEDTSTLLELPMGQLRSACWPNATAKVTKTAAHERTVAPDPPTAAIHNVRGTIAISVPAHQAHGPFGPLGRSPDAVASINAKAMLVYAVQSPSFLPALVLLVWGLAMFTVKLCNVAPMRSARSNLWGLPLIRKPWLFFWATRRPE